ncbi:MAG: [FeFe] hydrogenase H-cluster maturation GTPase HydF [Candidatus Omnitrophica bacterium]|nr:[FeFe] hydrogenase H-cluster maturation GTPase HydF [Candidatus Omnitrophota bacterium]
MRNKTSLSNRLHIGLFGRRNVGKSTLINAFTGQNIAIVSDVPGTTTDPVYKAMELHDIGPVVLIDTGGIDDEGPLGQARVKKAYKVLHKTDLALLVVDKTIGLSGPEEALLKEIKKCHIPVLVVLNKSDLNRSNEELIETLTSEKRPYIEVSALKKNGIDTLREMIVKMTPSDFERKRILSDLVRTKDTVVIVAPLDMEAPKGRLKVPQVQTIRDLLDHNCTTIVVKETELPGVLENLKEKPALAIVESQIYGTIKDILPEDIPLTSFSVLYARYKGELDILAAGIQAIENLKANDRVLIAEACTHHPIGDDIGRVVIPRLLNEPFKEKGEGVIIDHSVGYDFPDDLKKYKLIIHCGGCMLNCRDMLSRLETARVQGVPITNYGMVIAYMHGILERAVKPFQNRPEQVPVSV